MPPSNGALIPAGGAASRTPRTLIHTPGPGRQPDHPATWRPPRERPPPALGRGSWRRREETRNARKPSITLVIAFASETALLRASALATIERAGLDRQAGGPGRAGEA